MSGSVLWVMPTGEVVPEGTEGAILVDDPGEPAESDLVWLPDWYTRIVATAKAAIKAEESLLETLQRQHQRKIAGHQARLAYLEWRWLAQLKREVDDRLKREGGERKSVNAAYGRVGFRAQPGRWEITDEAAAVRAAFCCATCGVHLDDHDDAGHDVLLPHAGAVKTVPATATIVKKALKQDDPLPGTAWRPGHPNVFYVDVGP